MAPVIRAHPQLDPDSPSDIETFGSKGKYAKPSLENSTCVPFSQADGALLFHLLSKLYEHIVVRIDQRTATVDTGNGHSWRVPLYMLRHVLDI
ncbi:hypothetical protein [Variovorax boronicumulans]|uniref:hypothetical protein n=1 Tax=Variovorax boronicumulans TaxID=436515 RepID=UPI001112E6B7|nr:hypothetical protein [Variovorax boronicumulans]